MHIHRHNKHKHSPRKRRASRKCDVFLETKSLGVKRGGEQILQDINFQLHKGDFLAILGPNGAGKSTLLNALVGALPHSGHISWKKNIVLSYLPEDLSPKKFRELPITLRDFFRYKRASDKDIFRVFEMVGLEQIVKLDRNPGKLSTGQFQRMLIAWSIVDQPDILLFDEPTLGVDIGGEETIYTLLYKFWKERDMTIALVTHEINVVFAYATRVMCLRKEKLFYGKPKNILTLKVLKELYGPSIKFHIPHD